MMLRCASKFDMKEEDGLASDDTMLTPEERQAEDELREAQLPSEAPEPISDSEEEDSEVNSDPSQQPQPDTEVQSQHVMGKRPRTMATGQEDRDADMSDDETVLPLPNTQQSQHRTSGRKSGPIVTREACKRNIEKYGRKCIFYASHEVFDVCIVFSPMGIPIGTGSMGVAAV